LLAVKEQKENRIKKCISCCCLSIKIYLMYTVIHIRLTKHITTGLDTGCCIDQFSITTSSTNKIDFMSHLLCMANPSLCAARLWKKFLFSNDFAGK